VDFVGELNESRLIIYKYMLEKICLENFVSKENMIISNELSKPKRASNTHMGMEFYFRKPSEFVR
jgi:hypothetical protein